MQKIFDGGEKCTQSRSWRSVREPRELASEISGSINSNHMRNLDGGGVGGGAQRNRSVMNINSGNTHTQQASDERISKIIRRLLGETNPSTVLDLCKKLEVAVCVPANAHYICRSFELLLDNMLTVLKSCTGECAELASRILGWMYYVNRADFDIYKKHLFKAYASTSCLQKYIMMALKTTLGCDVVSLDLQPYSGGLFVTLKDCLENAALPENFIAVSETIAQFSHNYRTEFELHFTDIVDIIVGWHLEVEQTRALKLHCSMVLQQFAPYFVKELDFTFGLLGQFMEDIIAFGDDVVADTATVEEQQRAEMRFGAFVGAFTTIMKSLIPKTEMIIFTLPNGQAIVEQAFLVIAQTARQMLAIGLCSDETILNMNDFLCLVLANSASAIDMPTVEQLLAMQIAQLHHFSDDQQLSLLYLMLVIIRTQRDHKCVVTLIFQGHDNPLHDIKLTQNERLYALLLRIYHEVLLTKNVALLQHAYTNLTANFNALLHAVILAEDRTPTALEVAAVSTKLIFDLSALAVLATQTSSLISMYALHQPILNFLTIDKVTAVANWRQHRTLHSALLGLIVVHCQKHRQFVTSSFLLTDSFDSPAASNLTNNLCLLRLNFASARTGTAAPNLDLHLKWLRLLLEQCNENAALLCQESDFVVNVLQEVCVAAVAVKCPLEYAACMEAMLGYAPWLPDAVLVACRNVALQMLKSCQADVQDTYADLLARLPLRISLALHQQQQQPQQHENRMKELHEWYKATGHNAMLRSKYFKPLLEAIDVPTNAAAQPLDRLFLDYFQHCWTLRAQGDRAEKARELALAYQKAVPSSHVLLARWLHLEAARYCVHNKLRTALGKPQETFLAIEAVIVKYARLLAAPLTTQPDNANSSGSDGGDGRLEDSIILQRGARHLLGFLEQLDKCIYNAAEGSAFALLPAEKPAKNFFRINAQTCSEWFNRINGSVNQIALHCMEPTLIVRLAENMLKADKLFDRGVEQTITVLTAALLSCGESDALRGLYVWLKAQTGRRYVWIQHAAEQAAGRKELAADGYLAALTASEESGSAALQCLSDGGGARDFIHAQLAECLYSTAQWSKLRELQQPARYSGAHLLAMEALCYGCGTADMDMDGMNAAHDALLQLAKWPSDDEQSPSHNSNSYSHQHLLQRLESDCMAHVLRVDAGESAELPLAMRQTLRHGLLESLRNGVSAGSRPGAQQTDFLLLNHVAERLSVRAASEQQLSFSFGCSSDSGQEESGVLLKCLLWTRLFEQRRLPGQQLDDSAAQTTLLYLDVAARARREGNAQLCAAMLSRFFALHGYDDGSGEILLSISARLQCEVIVVNNADAPLLRGYSELAKCLYATQPLDAIQLGAALCHQQIVQLAPSPQFSSASASLLLTIADWLQQRVTMGSGAHSSPLMQRLLAILPEVPVHHVSAADISAIVPLAEQVIGRLIYGSIHQRSDCGEAWYAFGNWCWRWGKRAVEAKGQAAGTTTGVMTPHNRAAIRLVLGEASDTTLVDALIDVLGRHQLSVHEAECEGVEDDMTSAAATTTTPDDDCNTDAEVLLERELRQLDIGGEEERLAIVRIWRQGHRNVYAYYEAATRAYFRYLAIEADDKATADSTFVTTTLRLLRLIVKHAIGLQEALEEGLRETPLRPWKVIIPQLFSRLNHHEPYVRKSVADLLCRLSQQQPNLIIFPAVVGAQQEHSRDSAARGQSLGTSFGSLLTTLAEQQPQQVRCVELLVAELKRVTLLWEEYWLHALTQLYGDYATLFNSLDARKTGGDAQRLKALYASVIGYLVGDLERIAANTQRPPETKSERNFHEHYGTLIASTIAALKQLASGDGPVGDAWLRFKQLYAVIQQRALRNSAMTLRIGDLLSGALASSIADQCIAMPGVDTHAATTVYIRSVESNVYILPTKTRPKKLAFIGSDGRRYTYLFKGQEDLHLDERIMQFLAIANSMMARTSEQYSSSAGGCRYRAQHYSVIPLGPQSGLISWVDGVTPLFGIYKKWQQRDAALKQQQKERHITSSHAHAVDALPPTVVAAATRPSELFYGKLAPLLAVQGLKVSDPRKQWPLATLRRVLDELSAETPSDLLAKELWCHAHSAADWRKAARCYAISTAVMSVCGYVIGLGDRHLDNVLIKLTTGEMLHIDYNVCFEKGRHLRVPEKVPFRMTPNLVSALGITGIEGTFRLSCEHVLRTLRRERETLLTLLEAFVYDPLVDWTLTEDGAAVRSTSAHLASARVATLSSKAAAETSRGALDVRKQDWETVRRAIAARFDDIEPHWQNHKDELKVQLVAVSNALEMLTDNREAIAHAERERDDLSKQLAMIHELQALGSAVGSHALNTVSQRYAAYKQDAAAFHSVKRAVEAHRADIRQTLATYFECTLAAASHDAPRPRQLLANDTDSGAGATDCLKALLQYARVMRFYPRARLRRHHRLVQYACWYGELLDDDCDAAVCAQRHGMFEAGEADATASGANAPAAAQYAKALWNVWLQLQVARAEATDEHARQLEMHEASSDAVLPAVGIAVGVTAALQHLAACNEAFLRHEEVQTLSADPQLLDDQIAYIGTVQGLLLAQPGLAPSAEQRAPLQHLERALLAVRAARSAFELPLLERLVALYMRDDCAELQALLGACCAPTAQALELLQACSGGGSASAALGGRQPPPELAALLTDLTAHFDSIDEQLIALQRVSRSLLRVDGDSGDAPDSSASRCKQFVAAKVFDKKLRSDLGVARFYVIVGTFGLVRSHVDALNGSDSAQRIYDCSQMTVPIAKYVQYLQNGCLAGLTALYAHALHAQLAAAAVPATAALPADSEELSVCATLTDGLQRRATLEQCEQRVQLEQRRLEHHQLVASAHYWANARLIERSAGAAIGAQPHITNKAQLLGVLSAAGCSLAANCDTDQLGARCQALLRFERSLGDGSSGDDGGAGGEHDDATMFRSHMAQWRETYANWRQSAAAITPAEQAIVQLLDPEGKVEAGWISNIAGLLDEMTFAAQRRLAALEQEANAIVELLYATGQRMQPQIDTQLRVDIRHLLKTLLKTDRNFNGGSHNNNADNFTFAARTRDLQQALRHYHAKLRELQMQLLTRDYADAMLAAWRVNIASLLELSATHWQELLQLMQRLLGTMPRSNSGPNIVATRPTNNSSNQQNEQKRNAYAVAVWKRIRMKLEGRDPDANTRATVAEQVDYIIREAVNPDNLAVLYEGWTPWV